MTLSAVQGVQPLRNLPIALIVSTTIILGACSSDSTESGDNPQIQAPATGSPGNTLSSDDAGLPGNSRSSALGEVLVFGNDNLTLYTFASDTDGQSNCSDGCAADWPPIPAAASAELGDFNMIVRLDDSLQWAYKGRPLYFYAGDTAAGETSGEGLGNVWFVARPDPVTTGTTELGTVLVGKGSTNAGTGDPAQRLEYDGRTLYTFANDATDTSNCDNGCATNWPPLYADQRAKGTNGYSIITRSDGSTQWAYQSQPLYFYAGDNAPGDTLGEGVGGTWAVARPE